MTSCAIVGANRHPRGPRRGIDAVSKERPMINAIDQILTDVAAGKPAAVEACLRHFTGSVWNLARRYLHNDSDAEDATQEIFVDLWKSAHRFDAELGSAMTFVMTLARRRLIDRNRKRGRTPTSHSLTDAQEIAEERQPDTLELDDEVRRVSGAMQELRPNQREVLELALVHGRSHQQISETTGMALGTVKSHARRGLMRVRELLGVKPSESGGDS
ncbi:MAG: RNA polymerase sigma factor (sigma-70 family) [Planctomycetota bacterium]|jgi:RNA polymerase sigma factor (sigma-70 family)